MKKIDLFFIYNESLINPLLEVSNESCKIKIYIKNLSNYDLNLQINKINNLVVIYNKIQRINIIFDTKINLKIVNIILTKLSDILYKYYPITRQIKLYQVDKESNALMNELTVYKNIVMDPNKTPESYLEFIKSNVPPKYNIEITKLSNDGVFPLTYFVGVGSNYNSYFVHIKPKIIDSTKKDIFLIGKSVTYDAGGLNIKLSKLEEMKIDMCGSAIILSVKKLLKK